MPHARAASRSIFLALSLLSACAASDAPYDPAAGPDTPGSAFGHYLAGRFAMAEAEPDIGAAALSRAASLVPGDPDLIVQALLANLAAERSEAVSLAKRVPSHQIAQLVLADEDLRAGRWAAAESRYRQLPRDGLTQLLQPLMIAWAQQGAGHTDDALSTLRPYTTNNRFRAIFALHAAMISDLGNQGADAAHFYNVVRADTQDINLQLAQILSSWLARDGQPEEARRVLARTSDKAPELRIAMRDLVRHLPDRSVSTPAEGVAEAYVTLASALREQDQGELALLVLRLAFRLRPDLAVGRFLEEEIHATRRHYDLSLKAVETIPPRDPLIAMARARRALILARLDRTDEALGALTQLAVDYPDSPLPDTARGDVLRIKRRFVDAITAYSKAISRIDPPAESDWVVFYARGVAYDRAGKWPLAEADLKLALQLSPGQPMVLNYLGYSWADMGRNLNLAHDMLRAAAAERKNDGAIIDSLGWVMYRKGDVKGALRHLERAVELEPEDPTVTEHLGDVYFASGRKLEARYQWKRALTLNPAPDDVPKLEAKLKNGLSAPVGVPSGRAP